MNHPPLRHPNPRPRTLLALTLALALAAPYAAPAQDGGAARQELLHARTRYLDAVRDAKPAPELERLRDAVDAAEARLRELGLEPLPASLPPANDPGAAPAPDASAASAAAPTATRIASAEEGGYDPVATLRRLEAQIASAAPGDARDLLELQYATLLARQEGDWAKAREIAAQVLTRSGSPHGERAARLLAEAEGRLKLADRGVLLNDRRAVAAERYAAWKSTSWRNPFAKIGALAKWGWSLFKHKSALRDYRAAKKEVESARRAFSGTDASFDALTHSDPVPGNTVTLLQNGRIAYGERHRLARAATRTIHLQYLYFANDKSGNALADLLIERARDGVDVRVVVTGLDMSAAMKFDFANHIAHKMRAGGVKVKFKDSPLRRPAKIITCNHQKLFLVDDRYAITGGMNISDEYALGSITPEGWRDTDVLIEGPAVAEMKDLFLQNWELANHEPVFIRDDDAELARAQEKYKLFSMSAATTFKPGNDPRLVREVLREYFPEPPVERQVEVRTIHHHPQYGEDPVMRAFVWLIERASSEIILQTPYFIPTKDLRSSVIAAARRGVRVIIMTNSPHSNDMGKAIVYASRYHFHELLSAGVRIHEWYGAQTLHAKVNCFDGTAVTIGSYNLNSRSHALDTENIVLIEDERFAAHVQKMLHEDLERYTLPVTLEEADGWKKSFGESLKMKMVSLFDWMM